MIHVDPPPGISAGDDPCGRAYLRFAKREKHNIIYIYEKVETMKNS